MSRFALTLAVILFVACPGMFAGPVTETGTYGGTYDVYLRIVTNNGGNPRGTPHTGLTQTFPIPTDVADPLTFDITYNVLSFDPFSGILDEAWLRLGSGSEVLTQPTFSYFSGNSVVFTPLVTASVSGRYLVTAGTASAYYTAAELLSPSGVDLMLNPVLAPQVPGNSVSVALVETFNYALTNRNSFPFCRNCTTVYRSVDSGVTGSVTATLDYIEAVQVPEPVTLGLVGAGLVGIGLLKKRR